MQNINAVIHLYNSCWRCKGGEGNNRMSVLNKHDYVNKTIFCPLWTK